MKKTKQEIIPISYPCSPTGKKFLIVFTFLGTILIFSRFIFFLWAEPIVKYFLNVITYGYLFMYFRQCVDDSALGRNRAPEIILSLDDYTILHEYFSYGIKPLLLYFMPAMIYAVLNEKDSIYWIFFIGGYTFYPMAVMRCTVTCRKTDIMPHKLIRPMLKLFIPYLGLLILCGIYMALPFTFLLLAPKNLIYEIVFYPMFAYFLLIIAHMIGRFYLYHAAQLDWE